MRPRKVAGTSLSIALEPHLGNSDVQVFGSNELRPSAGIDGDGFPTVHRRNVDALHLRDRSRPHMLPSTIRDAFGEDVWERYFKFTIVRNPWDWFVSLHIYWMRWYDVCAENCTLNHTRCLGRRHSFVQRTTTIGVTTRLCPVGRSPPVALGWWRSLTIGSTASGALRLAGVRRWRYVVRFRAKPRHSFIRLKIPSGRARINSIANRHILPT